MRSGIAAMLEEPVSGMAPGEAELLVMREVEVVDRKGDHATAAADDLPAHVRHHRRLARPLRAGQADDDRPLCSGRAVRSVLKPSAQQRGELAAVHAPRSIAILNRGILCTAPGF